MEIARLTRSINRKYTNNITLIRSLAYRKNLTPRDRRPIVVQQRKRNEELDKKALDMKLDWRIMGAT